MNRYEYQLMNRKGVVGQITSDTPVAIRIKYVGGGSVTSVTNTAATALVLIATDSAGTSSTVTCTYSTDDTVGEVVDRINASDLWEAKVMDCLRVLATDSSELGVDTGVLSTTAVDGVNYYEVHADTSVTLQFAYRLTYDRAVGAEKPKGSHRVILQEIQYLLDVGTAAMDNFQVYETNPVGNSETQRLKMLNVDNSDTTKNWASGLGYITADYGNDLVVIIKDAATLTDSTSNFLTVTGFRE